MPNKIAAYYTTDQAYRAVASNHISSTRYDASSMTLYITFYNGASYKYYGVPKDLYEGMMRSPSHGVFFWENIRQRFPYELLESTEDNSVSKYEQWLLDEKRAYDIGVISKAEYDNRVQRTQALIAFQQSTEQRQNPEPKATLGNNELLEFIQEALMTSWGVIRFLGKGFMLVVGIYAALMAALLS